MLDVHVPHKSEHTWTDFFLHIATICVGLLIAIGLEQSVEAIHRAHERHDLREALHAESQQIVRDCERTDTALTLQSKWIRQVEEAISDAQRSHHQLGSFPPPPQVDWDVPNNSAFKAAKANAKLGLLADNEVVAFGELDLVVSHLAEDIQRNADEESALNSFGDTLRFGKAPGAALSSATPDELRQLYAHFAAVRASTETIIRNSRQTRGCALALLNGERDLRKIQIAER